MIKFVMKECKDVVDGNSNYQGTRMALIVKNSIDILEGVKMLMMITTFCCRGDPRRSN